MLHLGVMFPSLFVVSCLTYWFVFPITNVVSSESHWFNLTDIVTGFFCTIYSVYFSPIRLVVFSVSC